jgi:DNA invertase Pin-like site-specific DNA recombinase
MNEFMIGYARVSTTEQDLTAQRNALEALGIRPNLIYTDHGLTGTNRARPGLREALAACRNGDTLVVAKLDRLARSLRDAKDIVDEPTIKGVKLSIGGSVHDPTDPVGRLLFNVRAMVAEFESDLIRARTREGMQVAKAKGHLRGKQPKLSPAQQRHLMEVHRAGTHSTAELAELFNVARSTVYRTVQRLPVCRPSVGSPPSEVGTDRPPYSFTDTPASAVCQRVSSRRGTCHRAQGGDQLDMLLTPLSLGDNLHRLNSGRGPATLSRSRQLAMSP